MRCDAMRRRLQSHRPAGPPDRRVFYEAAYCERGPRRPAAHRLAARALPRATPGGATAVESAEHAARGPRADKIVRKIENRDCRGQVPRCILLYEGISEPGGRRGGAAAEAGPSFFRPVRISEDGGPFRTAFVEESPRWLLPSAGRRACRHMESLSRDRGNGSRTRKARRINRS